MPTASEEALAPPSKLPTPDTDPPTPGVKEIAAAYEAEAEEISMMISMTTSMILAMVKME